MLPYMQSHFQKLNMSTPDEPSWIGRNRFLKVPSNTYWVKSVINVCVSLTDVVGDNKCSTWEEVQISDVVGMSMCTNNIMNVFGV